MKLHALLPAAVPSAYQGQWSPDCAEDESLGLGIYAMEIAAESIRIGLDECRPTRQQATAKELALDLKCDPIEGSPYALALRWRLEGADKLVETDAAKRGRLRFISVASSASNRLVMASSSGPVAGGQQGF